MIAGVQDYYRLIPLALPPSITTPVWPFPVYGLLYNGVGQAIGNNSGHSWLPASMIITLCRNIGP
jgi:hypothetical protein